MSQHVLPTEMLDYELPPRLIAVRPAEPRDSARLLVLRRSDERVEHVHVRDLPAFLRAGDTLVFNTSAVAPARFRGRRAGTGARIEGLFVEEAGPDRWLVMLRCNGRLRAGDRVELLDRAGAATEHTLALVASHPEGWIVTRPAPAVLEHVGLTPLPPYILKARDGRMFADDLDRNWYQTVYADPRRRRSVAAPTAGLHFTPELLDRLEAAGVGRIDVTLHIGPGTFRPITAATVGQHAMHSEQFEVSPEAIAALRETAGRIVAVGSTAVRTLESLPPDLPDTSPRQGPIQGDTNLMIAPPYEFRRVDAMLTNFHLPRSTLLALVAALVGLERLKAVYEEAARREYRFYSYGDAMLILP